MVLDDRIVDVSTIHAPMPIGPRMPNRPIEIQEVLPHHQTLAS
jgi:hypothetical protein